MLKKIFLYFVFLLCFSNLFVFFNISTIEASSDVKISSAINWASNDRLDIFESCHSCNVFLDPGGKAWASWIKDIIILIAKDVKNLFYALAIIYFLIITIKLLFSSNSEEWFENYKKWLIWITLWIFVMQISYSFVVNTFDQWVSTFASNLIGTIFIPIINLLETLAVIFFILIAIYSFIRLLSANWDKEKQKKWIDSIIYATLWIFLVILSKRIIIAIYWKYPTDAYWLTTLTIEKESNFWSMASMFINFINWVNWFVAIVTLIMIMYAWVNIIFANWDEEKLKKWRTTIVYAFIWIFILAVSYLILTFFIWPDWSNIPTV